MTLPRFSGSRRRQKVVSERRCQHFRFVTARRAFMSSPNAARSAAEKRGLSWNDQTASILSAATHARARHGRRWAEPVETTCRLAGRFSEQVVSDQIVDLAVPVNCGTNFPWALSNAIAGQ